MRPARACARCTRPVPPPPRHRAVIRLPSPPTATPNLTPPPRRDDDGGGAAPDSPLLRASLALLAFYRAAISPALPKSCRFLPTCSEYAVTAYTRYGVGRGFLLTAWRLARCHPFSGASGYDPVVWPPPGWEWAVREK